MNHFFKKSHIYLNAEAEFTQSVDALRRTLDQQQRRLLHQLGIAAILDVGIPQQHTGPACKNAQSQSGQRIFRNPY